MTKLLNKYSTQRVITDYLLAREERSIAEVLAVFLVKQRAIDRMMAQAKN